MSLKQSWISLSNSLEKSWIALNFTCPDVYGPCINYIYTVYLTVTYKLVVDKVQYTSLDPVGSPVTWGALSVLSNPSSVLDWWLFSHHVTLLLVITWQQFHEDRGKVIPWSLATFLITLALPERMSLRTGNCQETSYNCQRTRWTKATTSRP